MITSQITWRRHPDPEFQGGPVRRWRDRRALDIADEHRARDLVVKFLATAQGVGLCKDTVSCAGIPGLDGPQVAHVVLGDRESITVRMLPGQLITAYQEAAPEFAEGLGVASVHFRRISHGVIVADLQKVDPLDACVQLPAAVSATVLMGMLDTGRPLDVDLARIAHLLVQGSTRSGKSRWAYGYLTQLNRLDHVRISGSDVSGLLLRPFLGTRHDHHLALGTGSIARHAEVLESLVKVMDERIARIPDDLDVLPITEADPFEVVVLEELPGLIQAAKAEDSLHKGERGYVQLTARIQAAYGRLLAEGAKVGFRLVIIMQRADAEIIGGFQRGQCTFRISFPVQEPSAVTMLHPTADTETAAAHTVAPAGRALVSGVGIPLARLRAPEMGDYAAFLGLLLDGQAGEPAA